VGGVKHCPYKHRERERERERESRAEQRGSRLSFRKEKKKFEIKRNKIKIFQ
jgi:hypothetical protein